MSFKIGDIFHKVDVIYQVEAQYNGKQEWIITGKRGDPIVTSFSREIIGIEDKHYITADNGDQNFITKTPFELFAKILKSDGFCKLN